MKGKRKDKLEGTRKSKGRGRKSQERGKGGGREVGWWKVKINNDEVNWYSDDMSSLTLSQQEKVQICCRPYGGYTLLKRNKSVAGIPRYYAK